MFESRQQFEFTQAIAIEHKWQRLGTALGVAIHNLLFPQQLGLANVNADRIDVIPYLREEGLRNFGGALSCGIVWQVQLICAQRLGKGAQRLGDGVERNRIHFVRINWRDLHRQARQRHAVGIVY